MMRSAGFLVLGVMVGGACSKNSKQEVPVALAPSAAPVASATNRDGGHKNGREDRHAEAEDARVALKLEAKVGGTSSTWHTAAFEKVPRYERGTDGDGREVWSLRELAHVLVGPHARVVAIVGQETRELDAAAWDDPTHTPILHTTRRGTLKFRWADQQGKWGEAEVKEVSRLEIEP